jgi:hypothetical protein
MPGCGEKLAKLTSGSQYDICMPGECMQMLSSGACITYNQNAGGCNRMLKVLLQGAARTTVRIVLSGPTGRGSRLHLANWQRHSLGCTGKTLPGASFFPPGSRMTPMT